MTLIVGLKKSGNYYKFVNMDINAFKTLLVLTLGIVQKIMIVSIYHVFNKKEEHLKPF
jgi:hypothetical protein